ncbi:hypothetical protein F511_24897 [Dorcoceras hygrometricum]|uniref:Uncharacterized protein n=1 Tax=Dorcoceras hygrometricum TaxID=472368 RepID=A0A2Z7BR66_9LAMI|nr:hypothetical protein F511_24897 [Dorcoceras hygrometricum]
MVKEYRKLSHSFEEAKAENMSLKSSSADSSSDELEDTDILKTELSKLQVENKMLKNETSELKAEVVKLTIEMSSWNKANLSLCKLYESQKQASDKTVIGFNNSEFCEGESSTQSRPAYDKFNKMSFVKADMIYNCLESVKYDNQNSPKLNENGKAGGTVASSRGDNLRWKVPVDWYTSRKIPVAEHQSQGTLTLSHSSEMASSLISRSHHVDFDSVFHFDDAGIVQMFESLVSTGLMEFLGCPAIFLEQALIKFFENGSVRDGMVVSTINGTTVEISESVFAAAFGLPTEGLTDLSEVPKDLLSNAQHLFSASENEVSISCLKKEVKMSFRLLSDILVKSLFVKAGSFDAAKGYAIQICVLLKNIPGLELGESKAFPAPRILNEKTVHRIVSVNENVGVEEVGDAPRAKTTLVKRTVSKKRPESVYADVAPVIKKKRTTKSKPVAAKKLVLEEPIAVVPSTEEQIPVKGVATEEHIPVKEIATEDADATIRQVLTQLDLVFEKQDDVQGGRVETWFDRAFDEEFVVGDQEDQASESLDHIFLELDTAGQTAGTMEVGDSSKQTVASKRSFEELMYVDDLLVQICDDMMLPSITAVEISKIRIGESIDKGKGLLVEDEPVQ